jgi:tRNA pseudouridine32 synthase/23S rRNA pseudouridine746 synthase
VRVRGKIEEKKGEITLPLDGKRALTRYVVTDYDAATDVATLDVTIETGRLHQIRRHLALIAHPVMGDPKYGAGNKNNGEGMQLAAVGLSFRSPFDGREMNYSIHDIVMEAL